MRGLRGAVVCVAVVVAVGAAAQEWTIDDPYAPPTGVTQVPWPSGLEKPALEPMRPEILPPDLVAWSVDLDADCRVVLGLRNHGGPVSPGTATYRLYVDGALVEERRLADLPDQRYTQALGRSRHHSEVTLGGSGRRLAFVVDPTQRIAESREAQNSAYRTASCALATPPPDLAVVDLASDTLGRMPRPLRIELANRGTATVRFRTMVRLHGTVDGRPMTPFDASVGPLAAGQSVWLTAPAGWEVPYGAVAEVTLEPLSPGADFDATNDRRRESLPPSFAAYDALLSDPTIADAVAWFDGPFRISYPQWTSAQRNDLRQAIARRDAGDPPVLGGPPPLRSVSASGFGSTIHRDDAWQVYLAFVAHGLWLEVNRVVPWSLLDLDGRELRLLFDAGLMFTPSDRWEVTDWSYPEDEVSFQGVPGSLGNVTVWDPAIAYQFLADSGFLAASAEETLYAVTRWMQERLNHTQPWHGDHEGGWRAEDRLAEWGYPGLPLADSVLYPLPGRSHRIEGCGANTGLYSFLMRSLNVPVELEWVWLMWPNGDGGTHRRPIFPSLGLTLSHADDPYEWWNEPRLSVPPVESLFHRFPQVSEQDEREHGPYYPLLVTEGIDCAGGVCNTDLEQTTFFRERALVLRSHAEGTGYLEDAWVRNGEPLVRHRLTGSFATPYVDGAGRDAIVAEVEQRLRDLGDGDLARGEDELRWRDELYRRSKDTAAYIRCCGIPLEGRVLHDAQGTGGFDVAWGVPGVELVLYEVGLDGVLGGGDDFETARVVSGPDGTFRFPRFEDGTYVVDVVDATAPQGAVLDPTWEQDPSPPRTLEFGRSDHHLYVYRPAPP